MLDHLEGKQATLSNCFKSHTQTIIIEYWFPDAEKNQKNPWGSEWAGLLWKWTEEKIEPAFSRAKQSNGSTVSRGGGTECWHTSLFLFLLSLYSFLLSFFSFTENRFFYYIICPDYSFPSYFQFLPSLPFRLTPFLSLIRNGWSLNMWQLTMKK